MLHSNLNAESEVSFKETFLLSQKAFHLFWADLNVADIFSTKANRCRLPQEKKWSSFKDAKETS